MVLDVWEANSLNYYIMRDTLFEYSTSLMHTWETFKNLSGIEMFHGDITDYSQVEEARAQGLQVRSDRRQNHLETLLHRPHE